jgi:S-adenosylmethionine hydrolase
MMTAPAPPKLIALFTDFGSSGPYQGQVKAVLAAAAPAIPVIDLLSNASLFNPRASAYLLAALARSMPADTLFLSVVDPGVGGDRLPLLISTGTQWFVGPDNGILSQVIHSSGRAEVYRIDWKPEHLSASFHGRDLFAPVAAKLCNRESFDRTALPADEPLGVEWPTDLAEIIYIDHFGNAMTGIDALSLAQTEELDIAGRNIPHARTFCDVPISQPFWYENSIGLVEIAVNRGSAAELLKLRVGEPLEGALSVRSLPDE